MQNAPSQYPRVFLSYSADDNDDNAVARQLHHDLAALGVVVYGIADSTGDNRGDVVRYAIEHSDWVVSILSPAAIDSRWLQADISLAIDRANQRQLRGVLLFVAKPCDPGSLPPLWRALERIDASRDYHVGLAALVARLGLSAAAQSQPAMEPKTGQPPDAAPGWGASVLRSPVPDVALPPAANVEEPAAAAAAPVPTWDADEIMRGWADDTPTMQAPREEETRSAPPPPPSPAPGGMPPAPPSPAPQQPAYPPAPAGGFPPVYPPSPSRQGIPDGAPAPGFGTPQPGQPMSPPTPGYPGYPPAPSYPPYPPAPGYAPPPAYGAPPNPMAPPPQGGYGYPGPFAPWPVAPVAVAEQVTFTAYHVKQIAPQVWEPVYVYISLDTPQAQAQVQAAAQQVLAGRMGEFRPAMAAETSWLRRGTRLTFVPSVPGCVFNPPEQTVPWQMDVQQVAFGMQAVTARPGFAVNGSVQVFTGPLLRADIPISIFVWQPGAYGQPPQPKSFTTITARAYRKVFASYSHRDTAVVQSCETAAQVTGDRYLRDVTMLRSGEQWNDRLLQAIGEADLFQLFWSANSASSPAVQTEWRHALALQPGRGNFIRPVYWSKQVYSIPLELQPIHFERLSLARLGWGKARIFLHDVLGMG